MRRRQNDYGIRENYAEYGLTIERVKALLEECREGKHTDKVKKAAQKAAPGIERWIIMSVLEGKSLHDMAVRWELGEADRMPCSRNSFYAYRKLTLAILDNMLAGKEMVQDGEP